MWLFLECCWTVMSSWGRLLAVMAQVLVSVHYAMQSIAVTVLKQILFPVFYKQEEVCLLASWMIGPLVLNLLLSACELQITEGDCQRNCLYHPRRWWQLYMVRKYTFIVEVVYYDGFCRRNNPHAFQCTEFNSHVRLVSLSAERDFQGDYLTGW